MSQQPVPGTRPLSRTGAGRSRIPYLALHPMGFAVPRRLRFERWALTPPFHPYRNSCEFRRYLLCGTFRRDASRHHLPRVSPTKSELRGIAPCGVRTFLLCPALAVQKRFSALPKPLSLYPKIQGEQRWKTSKYQAPSSREIPNFKHQSRGASWRLIIGASLELGAWYLEL